MLQPESAAILHGIVLGRFLVRRVRCNAAEQLQMDEQCSDRSRLQQLGGRGVPGDSKPHARDVHRLEPLAVLP